MNRKHFLSSALAAAAVVPALANLRDDEDAGKALIIPRYLQPGDTIGITSPAGISPCPNYSRSYSKCRIGALQ